MRIFIKSNKEKGQIAPFLIAIVVILITAIMVTVNLGKVAMTRTNTANAADAGALAGASIMANGLNAIKDMSTEMFMAVWPEWAILSSCVMDCVDVLYAYYAFLAGQIAQYMYATLRFAPDILEDAEVMARSMAFSNAGIDETKPRGGMNYEDWLKSDSNFTTWMDNEEYEDEDTYVWYDSDTKYGQSSRPLSARRNSVTVDVDTPNWAFEQYVVPGLITTLGWACCGPDCGPPCCPCFAYRFMVWGIFMDDDAAEEEITVTVSRVEPNINLGLWRMRYHAAGESDIRSSAEAQPYGGAVIPWGGDFDSRLSGAQ